MNKDVVAYLYICVCVYNIYYYYIIIIIGGRKSKVQTSRYWKEGSQKYKLSDITQASTRDTIYSVDDYS